MIDHAAALLAEQLNRDHGPALWWADENMTAPQIQQFVARDKLTVVSNRIDVTQQLQAAGFQATLSDFDAAIWPPGSFQTIYYRIGKEKPQVHHIINVSVRLLAPGGRLYLAGCKNEGIKTYIDKAAALYGESQILNRSKHSSMLAELLLINLEDRQWLDDKQYGQPRVINAGSPMEMISKPGIFGWNKIDQGSELLVSFLPNLISRCDRHPQRVLDLGCGYGYLSVMASQLVSAEFVATDNNIAAVAMCRQNFARHHIAGTALVDDCADSLMLAFDWVLCNPPFHQGFDVDSDLTGHFLGACRRLLSSEGCALFVVNAFIPLERKAADLFTSIEKVADNGRFKLILLRR